MKVPVAMKVALCGSGYEGGVMCQWLCRWRYVPVAMKVALCASGYEGGVIKFVFII